MAYFNPLKQSGNYIDIYPTLIQKA
jgi:hypothetical protein